MTSEGPMVARLRQALVGADETQIDTAATEWSDGALLLGTVKDALEKAKPTMARNFGRKTRKEAVAAFDTMIDKVEKRRKQMEDASTALIAAKGALTPAKELRDRFDANPLTDPGPFRPDPGMTRKQQNDAEAAHSVTRGSFMEAFNAREREAERAYQHMDTTYQGSGEVLRRIHGEPDHTGGGGGGGTGGSAGPGAPGGGTPSGSGTPTRGPQWSPTPGDPTWVPHPGHDHGDPGDPTTPTTTTPGVSTEPGVPQGPGLTPTTPGSTPLAPASVPAGSTPGAVGGVAGALGGGLLGGMAGVSGAVRGGGVSAVPSSASGARPIGSTSRTGASGALGRSASAAGSPASRAGANGAAGRGAAGRGAAGTGSPGSRGKAGARGSGARSGAMRGAGAMAGGAGRTKDKDMKKEQEFFEDVQDWIDDEGAAPGVID